VKLLVFSVIGATVVVVEANEVDPVNALPPTYHPAAEADADPTAPNANTARQTTNTILYLDLI
jgi:hypothetical protein